MTMQFCPTCGCIIGNEAYEKEGIAYCCEPCANESPCQCGCCKTVKVEKKPAKADQKKKTS